MSRIMIANTAHAAADITPPDPFAIDLADYPLSPMPHLWDRIRDGFRMPTALDQPKLQAEIKWYSEHPDYLERVNLRAEPFLYYILDEAEKRNMPTEMVLLPIVESAFQPFAYSHGRASGIWQFIPSTGRMYKLKQNWWYDGRRDVYSSTRAALDYLSALHKEFDNDWMLALAAYNSGSGTVRRAIRYNRKKNRPTDFWHLNLPVETRAYVPKLLALKELIENPEKYALNLRCVPDIPYFSVVDTGSQIDLALAAELAEIDLHTLYNLNPGFNRWATSPQGPHKILVPVDQAETFRKNLATVPASERVRWKRHKVKKSETLSHVALKYNTTVKELKRINKLRSTTIRAGKHLIIPVASRRAVDYKLSVTQRKLSTQSVKRSGNKVAYMVRPGDSFWDISRHYGVSTHELAKWNGMAVRDLLMPGQKLVIWTPSGSSLPPARNIPGDIIRPISYTVRAGDSLSRIAQKFKVSVRDLNRWNTIKGKYLQPGQRLKLYVDITRQTGSG